MDSKKYFLSIKGKHEGPFTSEQVLKKLELGEQQWTDYVYDDKKHEWIMLLEHTDFSLKLLKPEWPEKNAGANANKKRPTETVHPLKVKEWFVLRGQNNYGPFSQLEMIQMMQEKTMHEYDFVWNHKLPSWKRLAEVNEFSADSIKSIKESKDDEINEIFFRRRHARANYGASLLVHDHKKVYKGKSLEVSVGGAGILIDSAHFQPGQVLFLHFKPGDGVPPFNAICEIVSKHSSKSSVEQTARYGVRFKTVPSQVKENLRHYTEKNAA